MTEPTTEQILADRPRTVFDRRIEDADGDGGRVTVSVNRYGASLFVREDDQETCGVHIHDTATRVDLARALLSGTGHRVVA
jgi:hypothetical protein